MRSWQWYLENTRIPRLKSEGFTIVAVDEAFFVQGMHDAYTWGPVGTRSVAAYAGDYKSVAAFGCITKDGRQMFRTHAGKFKSAQFNGCLEDMRHKFGNIAVLCDGWNVHTSAEVKAYLAEHPKVKIIRIPKGSPYLNVV